MAVRDILQLGNPGLRARCTPVKKFGDPAVSELLTDLRDTLYNFRSQNGFGRGIAAPQIGSTLRVIFIDVGTRMEILNPFIVSRSRTMMVLWDDCFSFPTLLAKVRRNLSIEVRYRDAAGKRQTIRARGALSELLQHEIDHLDGILAIDRAVDSKHIIYRSEFERHTGASSPVAM